MPPTQVGLTENCRQDERDETRLDSPILLRHPAHPVDPVRSLFGTAPVCFRVFREVFRGPPPPVCVGPAKSLDVLHRRCRVSSVYEKVPCAITLVYPTPVFVVGTYDAQGKPNVMTASWAASAAPDRRRGVSLRKATLHPRQHHCPESLHDQAFRPRPMSRRGSLRIGLGQGGGQVRSRRS